MSDDDASPDPDSATTDISPEVAEPEPLDVLPPVERASTGVVYPELPPDEVVAITGEDGTVILERVLPGQLRVLYGALFPVALFWSMFVFKISGDVSIRGLDDWVFGEYSVMGTALAVATLPWCLLALAWLQARRGHGRCTLDGDLAVLESPLGLGRLGRTIVSRADVARWDETPVGFHLELRGEPRWTRWVFPSFVPAWSPRRRAAAREWLEGPGEIEPLRHLAQRPGWGRRLGLAGLGALLVLTPGVAIRVRYELGPFGGSVHYPAVETLLTAVLVAGLLAGLLLAVPAWRRRARVALVEGQLLLGETLVPASSLRRVALGEGRLALELSDRRRWLVEVPDSSAAAEALRALLPRGVTLDGALPGWARGRPRITLALALWGLVLWAAVGNPPLYAQRVYLDSSGQQAHLVYRLSDRRPVFLAVQIGDMQGSSTPHHAIHVDRAGLCGRSDRDWAGRAASLRIDLDGRRIVTPEGDGVPLAGDTTLVVWMPGQPVEQAPLPLPPELITRLDLLGSLPGLGAAAFPLVRKPFMGQESVVTLPDVWTVADILEGAADWETSALEAFTSGDTGTRTHMVEDPAHLMIWRARGDQLSFLVIVPIQEAGRLQFDYRATPSYDGRRLPRCARVRFTDVIAARYEVLEAAPPRIDTLSVVTDEVRRGRPLIEASRELLAPLWREGG